MSKYCQHLYNGITFHFKGLTLCNEIFNKEDSYIEYKGDFLKKFLERRNEIISDMKNDICLDYCQKCIHLKDVGNEEVNDKIRKIDIFHWNECNCGCFYCSNRNSTKFKIVNHKVKGQINILKSLDKLKKLGVLDDKLAIHTHGGEPTILKEFGDILKFALKYNYPVNIMSNGILYEKLIPQVLKIPNSVITISLDAGTRETYKQIKKVDKFNDVIKNVKSYVKDLGEEYSSHIIMKYIILKGINDNKEEIDKWINICVSAGIKTFMPSFEFVYGINNADKVSIPPHIIELYNYIKTRIKEINPNFVITEYDFFKERILKYKSYDIR